MPSALLEQEAQMFGLRDKAFPASGIGSPQHLQITEFIRPCKASTRVLNRRPGNSHDGRGQQCGTFSFFDIAIPVH
jgi:hypothetical protein